MKFYAVIVFFVALVALAYAAPAEEQYSELAGVGASVNAQSEALEVFGSEASGRQRICTAALCRAVCQSLGWPRGSCNAQLLCICRR